MVYNAPITLNGGGGHGRGGCAEYCAEPHPPTADEDAPPRRQLTGAKTFVRSNPMSDLFGVERFDHIEFWCGDAKTTSSRFGLALGLNLVAKSDQGTGNYEFASYVMQSNEISMVFSAPYGNEHEAHGFFKAHGIGSVPWASGWRTRPRRSRHA